MVRGCQKKIIYLKNTQSNVFEEAYFVIKNDLSREHSSEYDMVKEANRILEESFELEAKESFIRRILIFLKKNAIPFVVGILVGVLIALIL